MPHHVNARILWQPKVGRRPEEYEDAAYVSDTGTRTVRAAVADGATEAAYARQWAQELVRGFARDGTTEPEGFAERLESWRRRWRDAVTGERAADEVRLVESEHTEETHAAFLGLVLGADGTWEALCVGDCALFHIRDATLERAWPLDEGAAFVTRPALMPSRPNRPMPDVRRTQGTARAGDMLVLATDALAVWLFEHEPAVVSLWEPAEFQAEVDVARTTGTLRNDDVTALVLEVR